MTMRFLALMETLQPTDRQDDDVMDPIGTQSARAKKTLRRRAPATPPRPKAPTAGSPRR